ncbi:MAG: hypothetical protein ACK417_01945 [Bacteroidia bacterium]|jgi:hypothetical protein
MKKLMMLSVTLFALNLTVFAGTTPESKTNESRLESTCWTYAGPGETCWKYGTSKISAEPTGDGCVTVECPPPFPPCCIWLNSAGQAIIVVNEETITFSEFTVINPGNDAGQGGSIIGCLY